ncbi:MAG: hypothetical protein HYX41_03120 [Bdellovibrio sp.]|nr:hypothetical protein [Bdellovibrio sp.]
MASTKNLSLGKTLVFVLFYAGTAFADPRLIARVTVEKAIEALRDFQGEPDIPYVPVVPFRGSLLASTQLLDLIDLATPSLKSLEVLTGTFDPATNFWKAHFSTPVPADRKVSKAWRELTPIKLVEAPLSALDFSVSVQPSKLVSIQVRFNRQVVCFDTFDSQVQATLIRIPPPPEKNFPVFYRLSVLASQRALGEDLKKIGTLKIESYRKYFFSDDQPLIWSRFELIPFTHYY